MTNPSSNPASKENPSKQIERLKIEIKLRQIYAEKLEKKIEEMKRASLQLHSLTRLGLKSSHGSSHNYLHFKPVQFDTLPEWKWKQSEQSDAELEGIMVSMRTSLIKLSQEVTQLRQKCGSVTNFDQLSADQKRRYLEKLRRYAEESGEEIGETDHDYFLDEMSLEAKSIEKYHENIQNLIHQIRLSIEKSQQHYEQIVETERKLGELKPVKLDRLLASPEQLSIAELKQSANSYVSADFQLVPAMCEKLLKLVPKDVIGMDNALPSLDLEATLRALKQSETVAALQKKKMEAVVERQNKLLENLAQPNFSSAAPNKTDLLNSINKIGILGAGQMGIGIGYVAAVNAKKPVLFFDSNHNHLQKQLEFLDLLIKKNVKKGQLTEEQGKEAFKRIQTTHSIKDFSQCNFVIEAVSENPALKRELFASMAEITPPETILATNTSSISITKIAAATGKEDRAKNVIGMHFMNPVPVMQLVEIIPGLQTSDHCLQTTLALAEAMGKTTSQSKDMPGFIANRLLMPYINEAILAYQEGLGSREDIDKTMKLGTNMPMGPLTLADFIGLDTCLSIMKVLHSQFADSKYRPAPLLQQYVDAGWLGKKSRRGFYDYSEKK